MPSRHERCSARAGALACLVLTLIMAISVGGARAARRAASADGGGGAYTVSGTSTDVDLVNTGSTAWQSFVVIAPAGTTFLGGATAGEITAHCVAGQPDGRPNEVECGPLSGAGVVPGAQTLFVATSTSPLPCGSPIQLEVISTGRTAPTRVADVTPASTCSPGPAPPPARPQLAVPAVIHGTAVVGGRLTASPPAWTAPSTGLRYRWQLCSPACRPIARANGPGLRLVAREAGHSVRVVATASVGGVGVTSASARVAVHPGPASG